MKFFRYLFLAGFFVTTPVSAAVVINEIAWMGTTADPNGSYCEWIELANTGSESVNLTGWTLSIGATTKIFNQENGATLSIAPSSFYLVERLTPSACPDSVPSISADWSVSFGSGISNSGTTVAIMDASSVLIDNINASSGWLSGDNTTKETTQRSGSTWITGTPTPRATNVSTPTTNENSSQQETATTSTFTTTATNTSNSSSFPVEPQIFASAGEKKRTVTVGGSTILSGRVWGLKKEPIENARMLWNFGDGSTTEGKTVAHTYRYPGTYIVTLDASSGYYSASDRVTVEAVSADVIVSSIGDSQSSFVELYNKSPYELDLSFWSIRAGNFTFIIPEHTFVAAGAKIKFAGEVTGITSNTLASVALYYPNGIPANSYSLGTPLSTSSSPTNNTQQVVVKKIVKEQAQSNQENTKNTVLSQNTIAQEELPEENAQSALVGNAHSETPPLFWWIMGVCALAVVGVASAFFTKQNPLLEPAKNDADSYEIIEETENDKIPF